MTSSLSPVVCHRCGGSGPDSADIEGPVHLNRSPYCARQSEHDLGRDAPSWWPLGLLALIVAVVLCVGISLR